MMDGMTVHRSYVFGDPSHYERSIVHFQASWIKPLLEDLQIDYLLKFFTENRNGLIRTFQEGDVESIEQMFRSLTQLQQLDASYANEAKRKLAVTQLLLLIDSATVTVMDKGHNFVDERTRIAESVSEYIFQHYQESFTIEDIANALNMSKSYISHVFKEITGNTIMAYLMGYRLSQARNMLMMDHSQSIKEVAQQCGFESDAHFSRYFKQNVGMTPSYYRKHTQYDSVKGEW